MLANSRQTISTDTPRPDCPVPYQLPARSAWQVEATATGAETTGMGAGKRNSNMMRPAFPSAQTRPPKVCIVN